MCTCGVTSAIFSGFYSSIVVVVVVCVRTFRGLSTTFKLLVGLCRKLFEVRFNVDLLVCGMMNINDQ